MAKVPTLIEEEEGREVTLHGSWYRGRGKMNFHPIKAVRERTAEAVDRHVMPGWIPSKRFIDKKTRITAFGSCFAAHVSDYLMERNYNVHGKDLDIHISHLVRFGEGIVNTFAILQQFEWALENKKFSDNLWFTDKKGFAPVDPAAQADTKEIIESTDVFIITLGLSEIWYDKRTGEALWRAVPFDLFDEAIHGFRVSSHQENYENLKRICALIRHSRPHAKIIFTLSPIPLRATFRPISCVTANSVSKAILRSAIDQLVREEAGSGDLHYFPSYEIIKDFLKDPFKANNHHPKDEVVRFIMETFERHYCEL